MRAFFCLPVDEDVRAAIGRAAERVRGETQMAATWVARANYHVTLRFLGDIDPLVTVDLKALAARAAAECAPFSLALRTMGAFPSVERARVVWVGGETPDAFRDLTEAIERGLSSLGFPPEPKPAVAHVTIARLKGAPDRRLAQTVGRLGAIATREYRPEAVILMQSELGSSGARYSPLFSVPLPHAR